MSDLQEPRVWHSSPHTAPKPVTPQLPQRQSASVGKQPSPATHQQTQPTAAKTSSIVSMGNTTLPASTKPVEKSTPGPAPSKALRCKSPQQAAFLPTPNTMTTTPSHLGGGRSSVQPRRTEPKTQLGVPDRRIPIAANDVSLLPCTTGFQAQPRHTSQNAQSPAGMVSMMQAASPNKMPASQSSMLQDASRSGTADVLHMQRCTPAATCQQLVATRGELATGHRDSFPSSSCAANLPEQVSWSRFESLGNAVLILCQADHLLDTLWIALVNTTYIV